MASWPFWTLFFVVSVGAILLAKRLDDRDRGIFGARRAKSASAPPVRVPKAPRAPRLDETTGRFPTQEP